MSLPVKGKAAAVQRFIERALIDNRSLMFESVQFKRDRIQAEQLEAQVQWTLITALPSRAGHEPPGRSEGEYRSAAARRLSSESARAAP